MIEKELSPPVKMTRTERQLLALNKWKKAGGRGILSHPTGFGKTYETITLIKSYVKSKKDSVIRVIVPTLYLKSQWEEELNKFDLNMVEVQVINSAIKIKENVDLLIIDEIHRSVSDKNIRIFKVKKPRLILGLSATFKRLDGKHSLIEHFCPVVDVISIKEAVENGWVSEYKEYKVFIEPDDIDEYNQYSLEFQSAFSFFGNDFKEAMKCLNNIVHRRVVAKRMGISAKEMDAIVFSWQRNMQARKDYIKNHPKKLELAKLILEKRPGIKAITFSGTIKQAEKIGGFVMHSGKTKKKNRLTIEEFNSLPSGVLNTSKMLDEGADIRGLSLAVILSNSSSSIQLRQRLGRVIRKEGDKVAEIFHLVLKGTVEEYWTQNASEGMEYIEITEKELIEVLNGTYKEDGYKSKGKEIDEMFRL